MRQTANKSIWKCYFFLKLVVAVAPRFGDKSSASKRESAADCDGDVEVSASITVGGGRFVAGRLSSGSKQ